MANQTPNDPQTEPGGNSGKDRNGTWLAGLVLPRKERQAGQEAARVARERAAAAQVEFRAAIERVLAQRNGHGPPP